MSTKPRKSAPTKTVVRCAIYTRKSTEDPILLRQLQPIALVLDWRKQRQAWKKLGDHSAEAR